MEQTPAESWLAENGPDAGEQTFGEPVSVAAGDGGSWWGFVQPEASGRMSQRTCRPLFHAGFKYRTRGR